VRPGLADRVTAGRHPERFGTRVCRQCDARFSCDSYRRFARGARQVAERGMTYFVDPDPDQEDWRTAGLEG